MTRVWVSLVALLLLVACADEPAGDGEEPAGEQATETETGTEDDGEAGEQAAETETLRLASLVGPNTPDSLMLQWWAEQLNERTNGAYDVEFFFSESLLPGAETMAGIADGRADMGVVPTSFHPGELPLSSLSSVPFVTSNTGAYTVTFKELYEENDAYRQEWERQGVVPVVWQSNPPPIFGLSEPAESLDDLRGQRIRGFGYISQAMDRVGINAIALPFGEIYESVQRGVIDGYTAIPFEFITAASLHEVAPHVVGADLGQYGITATAMRQDLWEGLDQEVRDVILDLQTEVIEFQVDQFQEIGAEVCEGITAEGATVTLLPEEDVQEWKDTLGDSLFEQWEQDVADVGVDQETADAFRTAYLEGIERNDPDWEVRLSVRACANQ